VKKMTCVRATNQHKDYRKIIKIALRLTDDQSSIKDNGRRDIVSSRTLDCFSLRTVLTTAKVILQKMTSLGL